MLPFPGSLLLLRWALSAYPELWFLIGPVLVCIVLLVGSSWWGMIFRPTRRFVRVYVTEPYDVANWDRG